MTILDEIVEQTLLEVASRKQARSPSSFADSAEYHRSTLSLRASLARQPFFGVIGEIKRSSPAAGVLNQAADPGAIAGAYERNGAAGVSVVTNGRFFSGSLDDLRAVRSAVSLPLLRKDFLLDEYQIGEARAYGADAVLLIAAILGRTQMSELHEAAAEAGLEALIEVHDEAELETIDFDSMTFIGVNNRDLRTFEVDLGRTLAMIPRIPGGSAVVGESGVGSHADLRRLKEGGAAGALVGTHLMRSPDPGMALKQLLEGPAS